MNNITGSQVDHDSLQCDVHDASSQDVQRLVIVAQMLMLFHLK